MELRTMQERELLHRIQKLFPAVEWRFGTNGRVFSIMSIGIICVKRSGRVKWLSNVWETPEDFLEWINLLKEDISDLTSQSSYLAGS